MASDGSADIDRIKRALKRRINSVADQLGEAVLASIRDGSPITGAPGQPVDTGELKRSWQVRRSGDRVRVFSSLLYAPFIEEGARTRHKTGAAARRSALLPALFGSGVVSSRALTLRSGTGGFHSVKLTRVGMQKLTDSVVNQVRRADGG